ncbi:MAG: glycosyltransferase [Planctomycetes bacterium B3_Pla]|nr:MAG: glycosyltransferase [Planctomycetes bacterium B3_Pla]
MDQSTGIGNSKNHRPLRVLQVVTTLNRGGIETWLRQVLQHIDQTRFQMDFLVHTDARCVYDEVVESLGSKILHYTGSRRNVFLYARGFRRLLAENGPYDVIHCHIHWYAGILLREAKRAGIPVRIDHSHTDQSTKLARVGIVKRYACGMAQRWIHTYGTHWIGCSRKAGETYFGKGCPWRVLFCGIDLEPFQETINRNEVRQTLGIAEDAFVVGHVGAFSDAKNHRFLVQVFAEMAKQRSDACLLLIGHGPLRPEIEQQVRDLNLRSKVVFAGVRSDVPRLMKGAMDVLLMPSRKEGMPLVAVEAQAAGLPCFLSDVIAEETDVVPGAVERLSLDDSPSDWADRVLQKIVNGKQGTLNAIDIVSKSQFNILNSVADLSRLYIDAAGCIIGSKAKRRG